MKERADPNARERAVGIARGDPAPGVCPEQAVEAVQDVLASTGDTCPDCPPD